MLFEKGQINAVQVSETVFSHLKTHFLSLLIFLKNFIKDAEKYCERGNVEFQEERYENACQQYAYALTCLPKDKQEVRQVKYLCKRAACLIKLVCYLFFSQM